MTSRWTWGAFRIATESGHANRCGFFWSAWGISKQPKGPHIVTHIPTGTRLPFEFARRKQAQTFCEEIDQLADWKTISIETAEATTAKINLAIFAGALRRAGLKVTPRFELVEGGAR